jgi:hypothetical protein
MGLLIQHHDRRRARNQPPFTGASNPTATIFARPVEADARYDKRRFLTITDVVPPPINSITRTPSPIGTMSGALLAVMHQSVAVFG